MPDYLYRLDQSTVKSQDSTYRFLAKNCSNNELMARRDYFARHPVDLRVILRRYCNWTVDWAINKTDAENRQRAIILEKVRSTGDASRDG